MGYDMETVNGPDEAEQAAVREARARIDKLSEKRNERGKFPLEETRLKYLKAWDDLYEARRSYFRLNDWGMGECRDLMFSFGMLTEEPAPHWPEPKWFGLTDDDQLTDDPEWYDDPEERAAVEAKQTEADRAFRAAQRAVTEYDAGGIGIPAHKFYGNDGWLVTPRQITAALTAYEKAPQADKKAAEAAHEWWPRWIAYLEFAKDQGGFRVY